MGKWDCVSNILDHCTNWKELSALHPARFTAVPIIEETGQTPEAVWMQTMRIELSAPAGNQIPTLRLSSLKASLYTEWNVPLAR
jgi:hypothetical protein